MKSLNNSKSLFFLIIALIIGSGNIRAQAGQDSIAKAGLYHEIFLQDSILFAAFNARDVETFKKYFSEDLEFFHDTGGLTDYDVMVNFLITTAKQGNNLRRELVKGTLEVYPIPGYGAIEIGSHQFCHDENGKQDCGTFKFVQVWQKKEGQWKITRVVSYGH